MRIILVEDSETQAAFVEVALRHHKHHVWRVGNGMAALSLLSVETFDALILDLDLPDMHGAEVMRRLRETGRMPALVVAVTAGTTQSLLEIADEFNCRILRKQFSTDQLVQMLSGGAP